MVPGNSGSRIIRSWAGSGTCETIYETEDGKTWSHNPTCPAVPFDGTTGSGVGVIVGDRIIDKR